MRDNSYLFHSSATLSALLHFLDKPYSVTCHFTPGTSSIGFHGMPIPVAYISFSEIVSIKMCIRGGVSRKEFLISNGMAEAGAVVYEAFPGPSQNNQ